ncbi:MAG: hypothetical protein PHW13_02130 [Methylococcales bacterium]|nr:hypothetical protein [Methylococcales bacterium]
MVIFIARQFSAHPLQLPPGEDLDEEIKKPLMPKFGSTAIRIAAAAKRLKDSNSRAKC